MTPVDADQEWSYVHTRQSVDLAPLAVFDAGGLVLSKPPPFSGSGTRFPSECRHCHHGQGWCMVKVFGNSTTYKVNIGHIEIPSVTERLGRPVNQIQAMLISVRTLVCSTKCLNHNHCGMNILLEVSM